ncbi:MAG TPA: VWA domain-containing protein [Thiotrichaceae bacterium]|nr:VWA domain-containing protein [Thiotrichaceae bacterium]
MFDHYFGKATGTVQDYTISSSETAKAFGKIYVRKTAKQLQIQLTILMPPSGQAAEGWQTGVALDASSSMMSAYGRELKGELPQKVTQAYKKKAWIRQEEEDGMRFRIFEKAAITDALENGYFKYSDNLVQPTARKFIAYLASTLDINGRTSVIYWACGNGSQYEEVGDIQAEDCESLTIQGPKTVRLGTGTHLQPALAYYCTRFAGAQRGLFIFITDGYIDDLEAVKRYSTKLAKDIAANKRNVIKCILIGIGKEVDEKQMTALDDLDTGTPIDIWTHKLADDMRELIEIFADIVDENQIIAPTATIYDSDGQLIKKLTDGLPAKIVFELPVNSPWFEMEIMDERIRQTVAYKA